MQWIQFHKNNQWNILVIGNYYVNFQNYQNSMLLNSSDTKGTLMHLFLFTNWFQCVRRVYATAINFPCIITLIKIKYYLWYIDKNNKEPDVRKYGEYCGDAEHGKVLNPKKCVLCVKKNIFSSECSLTVFSNFWEKVEIFKITFA